jgi:hypothetical protein
MRNIKCKVNHDPFDLQIISFPIRMASGNGGACIEILWLPLRFPDQPKTHKVTSKIGRVTKPASRPAVSRFT